MTTSLGLIESPTYPSMLIDGLLWEKFATRPCPACGMPVAFVGVRAKGRDDKDGVTRVDGRTVRFGHGFEFCRGCQDQPIVASRLGECEVRMLDRGIPRDAIQGVIDHNRSLGSAIGGMVAEALAEILAEHHGERITKAEMRAGRFGQLLGPVIANMDDDAAPSSALFRSGPVRWGTKIRHGIISAGILGPLIDRHCAGDHGTFGLVAADLGERALFSIDLGSVAEQNRHAIDAGVGVVRSRYTGIATVHAPSWESSTGLEYQAEIFTFLHGGSLAMRHGTSTTSVIVRTAHG